MQDNNRYTCQPWGGTHRCPCATVSALLIFTSFNSRFFFCFGSHQAHAKIIVLEKWNGGKSGVPCECLIRHQYKSRVRCPHSQQYQGWCYINPGGHFACSTQKFVQVRERKKEVEKREWSWNWRISTIFLIGWKSLIGGNLIEERLLMPGLGWRRLEGRQKDSLWFLSFLLTNSWCFRRNGENISSSFLSVFCLT